METEIFITADGSHSLRAVALNETYHSHNGSLLEAEHNFIKMGIGFYIANFKPKKIAIFEMGFGTGLNAFQTLQYAQQNEISITYHSLEGYPLSLEITNQLNYKDFSPKYASFYHAIHQADWNKEVPITPYFTIQKIAAMFTDYTFTHNYDLVFYDAFGPQVQPLLWTKGVFKKLYTIMNTPAVLSTYSAATLVRKNLYQAGFWIDECRGAAGKKQMTRAIKW